MYLGVKKRRYFTPLDTSPDTGANRGLGAEVRVALTEGQRTRIANSCAPCDAGSLSSGVLGRGRVKRIRSRGKDRVRDGERQAEREGLTDRP